MSAKLRVVNKDQPHNRDIAHVRVADYRARRKEPEYDFNSAPKELKLIMYGGAMRFRRRSLLARLLGALR